MPASAGGRRERGGEGARGQDAGQALAVAARSRGCRRTGSTAALASRPASAKAGADGAPPTSERSACGRAHGPRPDAEAARRARPPRAPARRGSAWRRRRPARSRRGGSPPRAGWSRCAPATAAARSRSAARLARARWSSAATKKSSAAMVRAPRGAPQRELGAERHHHRRQLGRPDRRARGCRPACRACGSGHGRRRAWPGRSGGCARVSARSAPACAGGRGRRCAGRRRGRAITVASSATRLMSIRWPGRARRKLSMGMRLWPPARTLAPSPWRVSRPSASSTVAGS